MKTKNAKKIMVYSVILYFILSLSFFGLFYFINPDKSISLLITNSLISAIGPAFIIPLIIFRKKTKSP